MSAEVTDGNAVTNFTRAISLLTATCYSCPQSTDNASFGPEVVRAIAEMAE